MKNKLLLLCLVSLLFFLASCQTIDEQSTASTELEKTDISLSTTEQTVPVTIILAIKQTEITVELNQTKTAQDLLSLLPLTLSITNWNDVEYYGRIDEPLSVDSPSTNQFTSGDVMYDPTARNLALFYDTKPEAEITGFIKIGVITSDLVDFKEFDSLEELIISQND